MRGDSDVGIDVAEAFVDKVLSHPSNKDMAARFA